MSPGPFTPASAHPQHGYVAKDAYPVGGAWQCGNLRGLHPKVLNMETPEVRRRTMQAVKSENTAAHLLDNESRPGSRRLPAPSPPVAGGASSTSNDRAPRLAALAVPMAAQVSGNRRTQLEEPAPYALVGNIQTSLRKKILHIPIAQSEPGIEPNGASNDFRWKAVTFEGDGVHPKRLHRNHQIEIRALNVTMPRNFRCGHASGER